MRRLPGILLLTGATLIVIVALLVSGLRLALPYLDSWRPTVLQKISEAYGQPVNASRLEASWQNFGPTLDARDITFGLSDGGSVSIERVTLALDVWQSLLHFRWQFRDLTFHQLNVHTNTPIDTSTLLNSQYRELINNGVRLTGRVGYTANYAVFVHDPNVPQTFRRATAQKEFLTKGFEDTRSQIDAVMRKELSV